MRGDDIRQLIPQRDPILMVDALLEADGEEAHTSFTIAPGNFFLGDDGKMDVCGLIEHVAQSASAFAGHQARMAGATQPPVGYIGEVRKLKCYCRPQVGDTLHTTILMGPEADGVTLLTGTSRVGERLVVETQMKIFMKPVQG